MKALKVNVSAYHNEVTGSRFLVVVERPDDTVYRIVVDYGYFQEPKYRYLNYVDDLNPEKIDAIVVTHNHIDHTGLIPKAVRQGYRNKIYMTEITQELIGEFLYDSAEQQEENAHEMRERYPNEAHKFNPLYYKEDVEKTLKLCVGLGYRKTLEILPGVKLTFWENAHILGAGLVLLQCSYPNMKSVNCLFTGDFKFQNSFTRVPMFPKWFRNMEMIIFCESTYGTTTKDDIKECFRANILEAFERKQDVLIGAFAQDRMQGILYDFKLMQDEGLIPPEYQICVDGPLGISTCSKYHSILEWYNPTRMDFMPKGIRFMDHKTREHIFEKGVPKIVITTSGMLNNGPARVYVPMFLEHDNTLIHLVGYAAEETLARKLLDAKRDDTIKIGSQVIQKRAVIKTTREKTSHATKEELIELINMFNNVRFLGVNHGNTDVKDKFCDDVLVKCPKVEQAGILDREHMYSFYRLGLRGDANTKLTVKSRPAGLLNDSKLVFGREATPEELHLLHQKQKEKRVERRERNARKGKKNGKKNKPKKAKKKPRAKAKRK